MIRTCASAFIAMMLLWEPVLLAQVSATDRMRLPWQVSRVDDVFTAFVVRAADPNTLTVQIGQPGMKPIIGPAVVTCRIFGPGGRLIAAQSGANGEAVSFNCADWEDGPYEIRFYASETARAMSSPIVRWYKGEMLAAARELVRRFGPGGEPGKLPAGFTPEMLANCRMLAELVLGRLNGNGEADAIPPNAFNAVHSALMEYQELRLTAGGQSAQIRGGGFFRLVYKDEVDGSWQFCRVYLPPGYDPAQRWPLVVVLHGYYPSNPPYVHWWDVDRRHHGITERHDVIVIEPHARGNAWYRGLGERDVLRCIAQTQQRLAVDADRILLMGYSMGGGGTWNLGTRHPHLFAGIAPIFGGWDYRAVISSQDYARLMPVDHFFAERSSSFLQAEALLSTPVFLNHGDADELVSVEHTRYATRMLQRWGYDVRYWEHPGRGHGGLNCEDEIIRWFLMRKRVLHPRQVRVRSAELKAARAHWLAVEQCEDPLKLILADARIIGENAIRLDTQNVLQITLSPGGKLVDAARPITVIWNGQGARTMRMEDGRLMLRAQGYEPAANCKSPRREGPIRDYQTTPFAIVLGTIADSPEMHFALQYRAHALAKAWESWQKVQPRFFSDNTLGDDDLASYSLILVGGPNENAITRKLAARIPLQLSAEQITIDGRAFEAKDAVVQMIYPHPLNAGRYVVVIASNSPNAMFFADEMPDDVDFAISDGRISPRLADLALIRGNGRPDPLALVASGFFDHNWRLNEKFIFHGDANLRAACAVRKVPQYRMAPQDQQVLFLSDLLEVEAEGNFRQMRRDLNFRGYPLVLGGKQYANGLAAQVVREAPSYVEFDIAPGPWSRLKGTIGIEVKADATAMEKERTSVTFIVRGDGKELYRSPPFGYETPPRTLDIDITGVRRLRLDLSGEGRFNAAISCNWCEIRLER